MSSTVESLQLQLQLQRLKKLQPSQLCLIQIQLQSTHYDYCPVFFSAFYTLCLLLQLLKKLSRVLYNIVVLFVPWEMRIKKIESESQARSRNAVM